MLKLSAAQPLQDPPGRAYADSRAIVYDAKPIEIVLNDQGEKVVIDLRASNSAAPGNDTPSAEAFGEGPVPLDAMHIDLRLVKEFGENWPMKEYTRMMLARWHYEQTFTTPTSMPVGGRFFNFLGPKSPMGPTSVLLPSGLRNGFFP